MANLMQLPVEIRLRIINYVVYSTRESPDPAGLCAQDRTQFKDVKTLSWSMGPKTLYETSPSVYIPNANGLVITNKQLRMETLQQLLHSEVDLDIVMVNEATVYPTWTYIPVKSRHVDVLRVTVRLHGSRPENTCSDLSGGDGGPPVAVWPYFDLVQRYLQVGPTGAWGTKRQQLDFHHTIGELYIDFITPEHLHEEVQGQNLKNQHVYDIRSALRADETAITAAYLCFFLHDYMRILISNIPDFSTLICERIGYIRFRLDGKELELVDFSGEDMDVACIITSSSYSLIPREGFHKMGELYFTKRCIQVMEYRKNVGLPSIDLETWQPPVNK